ncbi:MAG: DUF4105 domain-containing protein [Pseudomonadota bacterium]
MLRLVVLLIALLASRAAFAFDMQVDALIARADALALHEAKRWRDLLHFRENTANGTRSEIAPGPFFLSPEGPQDARAELIATLRAAFDPVPSDPNAYVVCRYPARMRFLQNSLAWQPANQPPCPDLQRWRRNGNITSISLVFASGDLGNPASFFGHILMKFNEDGDGAQSAQDLDDRSVNFGALVPENENAVVYMARGLLGGYPSSYSSTTYFQQRHDYADSQLRDLWEYRLNLDPDEVALLVDHTWELQDARNTYFFLTRNCAYEFATLLSVVLDQPTMPGIKIWSTPADLFEELSEMTRADGRPVVAEVSLVASRQQDFRQAYAALERDEQRALRQLLAQMIDAAQTERPSTFQNASPASQARILEVALIYARFGREKFASDEDRAQEAEALQRQLVLLRLGQPAGRALTPAPRNVAPPSDGHRTSLLQITPLSNSALGDGVEIRLRPAYSDLLSLDAGALPYAGVAMGDLSLMIRDGRILLRRLDLLRVDAFNVSPTGLPYDRARAWKFRVGAEDRDLTCDSCIVGFAEGAIGFSLPFGQQAAAAMFLETRFAANDRQANAEAGPGIAFVGSLGDRFRLVANARYLAATGDDGNDRFEAGADMRFGQSQTWDIRLRSRYLRPDHADDVTEFGVSASWFF